MDVDMDVDAAAPAQGSSVLSKKKFKKVLLSSSTQGQHTTAHRHPRRSTLLGGARLEGERCAHPADAAREPRMHAPAGGGAACARMRGDRPAARPAAATVALPPRAPSIGVQQHS